MIERATGLVLRLRPLTETSLIVHWLTPSFGRLATVAKGARRTKSPFRGRLDLFYLADFSFTRSRTSELHTLREIDLRQTHGFLRQSVSYLQQAAYCVRLIEQATETETPLAQIYRILCDFLEALSACPAMPQLIFGFELKMLAELGFQPDLAQTGLTAGAKAVISQLDKTEWSGICRLRLNPAQQTELQHFLHRFLLFHLGRVPKGREAALDAGEEKKPA
jgi:DNA repair protein RecO (recombination protein O)